MLSDRFELKSPKNEKFVTIFEAITLDYGVPKLPVKTRNEPKSKAATNEMKPPADAKYEPPPKAATNESKPPVITKKEPQTQTTTNNDIASNEAAKDEVLVIPEALPLLDDVSVVSCDVNYLP